MKRFVILPFLLLMLMSSCQSPEDAASDHETVSFTEDEIKYLIVHGYYERAMAATDEQKLEIKKHLAIPISLGKDLQALADSFAIAYPEAGIEYAGIRYNASDSTKK